MNDDQSPESPLPPQSEEAASTPAGKEREAFARGSMPSTHELYARGTPRPGEIGPDVVQNLLADIDGVVAQVAPKTQPDAVDLEDIQGIVYSGWGDHEYAGYLFATLGTNAIRSRAWLAAIRAQVSSAAVKRDAPGERINVALSPRGLEKLGVPAQTIEALPLEAKKGMASRARILRDDDPSEWELGRDNELDALVMVFARSPEERAVLMKVHRDMLEASGATVRPDELSHHLEGKEHFGFKDGISQPFLLGKQARPKPHKVHTAGDDTAAPSLDRPVPTGEILLGYVNAYGQIPASPKWGRTDLGRNGTYLVFRKLQQHVDRFWGYVSDRAKELEPDDPEAAKQLTEMLAAKMVGRWKSGVSLVQAPNYDVNKHIDDKSHVDAMKHADDKKRIPDEDINRFDYKEIDPDGLRCPISSHVRRANPRDARGGDAKDSKKVVERHRILRRGRSYGTPLSDEYALDGRDDGKPRGLYFICLQASIARGFEFIQQTWLSNPGFNGLFCELDPIMGNGDGTSDVTIPMSPVRLRLPKVPSVVTVKGGGYFFLPSLNALTRIAAG